MAKDQRLLTPDPLEDLGFKFPVFVDACFAVVDVADVFDADEGGFVVVTFEDVFGVANDSLFSNLSFGGNWSCAATFREASCIWRSARKSYFLTHVRR